MADLIDNSNPMIETFMGLEEPINLDEEGDADMFSRFEMAALEVFQEEQGMAMKEGEQNARLIGPVPGVEVGDQFEYRVELLLAGLHGKLQKRIDSVEFQGRRVATCVVAIGGDYRYKSTNDLDVLIYHGEDGGKRRAGRRVVMKGGNLALKNSCVVKTQVRVVRRLKVTNEAKFVFVYDGLYEVVGWAIKTKKGDQGNMAFEFEMKRKPGQARINWKLLNRLSLVPSG